MSFIRPEALAALRLYGEPAFYGAIAIWGLWRGWALLDRGAWLGAVLLVIGALAALGLFGAVERALLAWRGRRRGPGAVSIAEGQIAYFGPEGGAVMALDALVAVEIRTIEAGPVGTDLLWYLRDELGQQVAIPGGAHGAVALLDRLGTLPGFDHMAVISAMRSTGTARFPVWARTAQRSVGSP